MTTSLTTPSTPSIFKRTADELKLRVSAYGPKLQNVDQYMEAVAIIQNIASAIKRVEDHYDPKVAAARVPYALLLDERKEVLDTIKQAQTMVNRLKFDYDEDAERVRRAEERELEAAENAKIQREANALADKLKTQGDKKGAREVIAEAKVTTAVITVPSTIPATPGMYNKKPTWEYEIVDQGKVNESYLHKVPNEEKIAELVKRLGLGAEQLIGKGSIKITRKIPNTVVRGAR
jgi:hypothetical protein